MADGQVYGFAYWWVRRFGCRLAGHRWIGVDGVLGRTRCARCQRRARHVAPDRLVAISIRLQAGVIEVPGPLSEAQIAELRSIWRAAHFVTPRSRTRT